MEKNISFRDAEFIGRESELSELKKFVERTSTGTGETVLISGEAGVGKTRLISELIETAEEKGFKSIKGWCLPDTLEPLLPFREAFLESDLRHLISGEAPPKVISAYLINEGGLVLSKAEREDTMVDPDMFAGMLKAVENFIQDSLSEIELEGEKLETIAYGDYQILIQSREGLSLATVIEGVENEHLIDDMRKTLDDIDERFNSWSGDADKVEHLEEKTTWFIESGKYDGVHPKEESKVKKEALFENILLGIKRLSLENPILLFIDDLHWADSSSLSLLYYLAKHAEDNRLLIIGAYRPEEISCDEDGETQPLQTTMQDMNRENLYKEIKLERLTKKDTTEIIESSLSTSQIDKEFMYDIYRESEGNPFFISELLKYLVEEGYIEKKEGVWTFSESMEEVYLPSKIYDVVDRRLNRLLKEENDILECASVVGEKFRSKIVKESLAVDRLDLLKKLNDIEKKHKLVHSLEDKYEFDHSKVREVLYEGINQELKEEYHRRIAEAYEEVYEDSKDEVIENIAHHYYKANDEKAAEYLIKAGDKAKDEFGLYEAVNYYYNSLSFIKDNEQLKKVRDGLEEVLLIPSEMKGSLDKKEVLSIPSDMKGSLDKYVFSLGKKSDKWKKEYLDEKISSIYDDIKDPFSG